MPSGFLAKRIAEVIAQPKIPIGVSGMTDWQRGNRLGEERLSWPLVLQSGEPISALSLTIVAYPSLRPQEWHLNLLIGPRVMGLDYQPEAVHTNHADGRPAGMPLTVRGPHVHLWEDNRQFCKDRIPDPLPLALPLRPPLAQFAGTLRWFCDRANIVLPAGLALDLPARDMLF